MKRKLMGITAGILCSVVLTSCDFFGLFGAASSSESAPSPSGNASSGFEVSCEIYYAKDGDKKQLYSSTHFEINTKIFVCVDFTLKKNSTNPVENIDFKVQIPYAEYYSTKEFYQGTIIPKENPKIAQDLYGNTYTIMELTDMTFVIDDNETHPYYYMFEIEANQVCEEAEFIARFEPENRNLSVTVNGSSVENACRGKYSFFEAEA